MQLRDFSLAPLVRGNPSRSTLIVIRAWRHTTSAKPGQQQQRHQPQEGIEIVAVCQAAEQSPKRSLGQYSALVEISPLAIRVRSAW